MTDTEEIAEPVDGRVARRQRNISAVLDVVLEMFGEEAMFPTIEQVATRSGLSLRSLYRYFADPGELLEATIRRSREQGLEVGRIHAIGQGSLDERIEEFVSIRLRTHDAFGSVHRASMANAAQHPRVREELERTRQDLREQFEIQFSSELAARANASGADLLSAGDLLTQLQSIDYLRRDRNLSVAATKSVLVKGLHSLLD